MQRRLVLIFCFLAVATPCYAQWLQQKKEDPFDGKHLFIAVTGAGSYGFGVRCEANTKTPEIVFITPEKLKKGAADLMNQMSPKLVVIVDEHAAVSISTTLEASESDSLMALSNDTAVKDLAQSLITARKRVAVAIEAGGQKFHKAQFGVQGSKKAVEAVVVGCGTEPTQ